jgi:rhombotail lipoprotein
VSEIKKSSTLVEVNQEDREAREKGFELAMADMSKILIVELDRFKEKIKEDKSV